jgi:hypothetical protein
MLRIHTQKGGTELVADAHRILAPEKPREHGPEFGANALAPAIGTNRLEVPQDPDHDQDEDHRGRNGQHPQRQPERSDDDE